MKTITKETKKEAKYIIIDECSISDPMSEKEIFETQRWIDKIYIDAKIENYIVDFFSPKACVVIELDGSQHYEKTAIAYDKERTRLLETYGFTVLRYTNLDINKRFKEVCEDIHLHIQKNLGYDPYSKR